MLPDYDELIAEWAKPLPDMDKCSQLLMHLKVVLTETPFLPTRGTVATRTQMTVARDILEIGAQWSVAAVDVPSFERYMSQLKCYYLDYNTQLPESSMKHQLLGLNLLMLLSQDRVAEFHTELERLPIEEIQGNAYIRIPVSLEQFLMEGSYAKVFSAKDSLPADSYNVFFEILLESVRNEIADCIQKAYKRIPAKEAAMMMHLTRTEDVQRYVSDKWRLTPDGCYVFEPTESTTQSAIPSEEVAQQSLQYAEELLTIV